MFNRKLLVPGIDASCVHVFWKIIKCGHLKEDAREMNQNAVAP